MDDRADSNLVDPLQRETRPNEMGEKKVVLVTGGSGLVGSAIREVIEETKPEDEEWIFASSKVRRRRRLGEKMEHEC